jgi:hypothetical protein
VDLEWLLGFGAVDDVAVEAATLGFGGGDAAVPDLLIRGSSVRATRGRSKSPANSSRRTAVACFEYTAKL